MLPSGNIDRIRSLAGRECLWVNRTGNGVGLAHVLDELGIEYFPITVLGGGPPLPEDYEQAVFRKDSQKGSGVSLQLLSAHPGEVRSPDWHKTPPDTGLYVEHLDGELKFTFVVRGQQYTADELARLPKGTRVQAGTLYYGPIEAPPVAR